MFGTFLIYECLIMKKALELVIKETDFGVVGF